MIKIMSIIMIITIIIISSIVAPSFERAGLWPSDANIGQDAYFTKP